MITAVAGPITQRAELSILKALAYFDIFQYPLSEGEMHHFLDCHLGKDELKLAIERLESHGLIFKFDGFYCLWNDPGIIKKRVAGNLRAHKLMPRAGRIASLLYRFPFVKAVAISGSLSKNYADAKADIDFFIITNLNRLWVARTFLHLFKKLTYLAGRQHYYCMNYFVDEQAMAIAEQNIYSATEVVTLLPVAGIDVINDFFNANRWTEEWLPAYKPRLEVASSDRQFAVKSFLQRVLTSKMGDKLDDLLFHWTTRRWRKKEDRGLRNIKGRKMNLVTGKHFSKSDPGAFQEKIVRLYDIKVDQLTSRLAELC